MGIMIMILRLGTVWAGESSKAARQPVPGPEAVLRAEATIREVYQTELAKAAAASEKQKLALKWMEKAGASSDDPALRWSLLKGVQQIGLEIADVELMIRAIEEAGKYFELDVLSAKRAALQKAAEHPRPAAQARLLAEKCLLLMHQAIKQEDFSWAVDCGRAAYTAAQQANSPNLLKSLELQAERLRAIHTEYQKVQAALKVLAQQPDDPEANRLVGRYLCLVQENWARGLPHLARSNDPDLKPAAEKDLAQPSDVRAQIDLADLWWELAQKQSEPEKETLLRRAGVWYRRALPEASGLDKTKATLRLGELMGKPETEKPAQPVAKKRPKSSPSSPSGPAAGQVLSIPEGSSLDLLKQIDPKKHRVAGSWLFRGGRLVGDPGPTGAAGLRIPLLPTGAYELQIEFTRTAGEGMIGFLIPVGPRRCVVVLDCRPGIHGIDLVAGRRADDNPTTFRGTLQTGRKYLLEIKASQETDSSEASITVSLDDRPWLFYRGPAQDLDVHKDFMMGGPTGLALLSRCSVAIHSLQLLPRSGQVHLLPEPAAAKSPKKD